MAYSSQGSHTGQLDLGIPGLNPKFLRSAYDVKARVLLIAIRPSDGDVMPGGPFGDFRKRVG